MGGREQKMVYVTVEHEDGSYVLAAYGLCRCARTAPVGFCTAVWKCVLTMAHTTTFTKQACCCLAQGNMKSVHVGSYMV